MAAASNRNRILAVVAIAVLCVVGVSTVQIAAKSDGVQHDGEAPRDQPTRYVDPEYGFSLMVDPRFAGQTAPGLAITSDQYVKSWNAADSPTSGAQPLDTFSVVILDRPVSIKRRRVTAELRTILSRPSEYASGWGADARLVSVAECDADGHPAAAVEALFVGLAGARVRSRQVVVPMEDRLISLTAMSSPATWRRNLPAFEAMVASFRLPPDER